MGRPLVLPGEGTANLKKCHLGLTVAQYPGYRIRREQEKLGPRALSPTLATSIYIIFFHKSNK